MFFLFSTVYKKYLHLHTAINNNGFCRFGFAIQIIYPGIYNPKSSKDIRPRMSLHVYLCFLGNILKLKTFPMYRDLKLPSYFRDVSGFYNFYLHSYFKILNNGIK